MKRAKVRFPRRFLFSLALVALSPATLKGAEPADTNYDEEKVPPYTLPPFFEKGTSEDDRRGIWLNSRREEVLDLLAEHVYGRTPLAEVRSKLEVLEESNRALAGAAVRRQFRLTISPEAHPERALQIEVLIYSPKHAKGRVPAFIGLNFYGNQTVHPDPDIRLAQGWMRGNGAIGIVNHRATAQTRGVYRDRWQVELLLQRGYGLVTAYCGDIDPDNYRHDFSDGTHPLFYREGQSKPADDEWGTIGAWAWGLSRMREALQGDPLVDASRLAVIGHSRLGKTALWAGAQDQKFAMVVSNNSGSGGAALYRRCYGERIHHMLGPVGYWFCKNHATYAHREAELPVDQHMLLAAIAPRPLYVASATNDQWADPRGEFLAAQHASRIYELLGGAGLPANEMPLPDQPVMGRIGYHLRSGEHDVTAFDWHQYLAFADRHLSGPPPGQ